MKANSGRARGILVFFGTLAVPVVFLLAFVFNLNYGSPVPPVKAPLIAAQKWLGDKVAPLIGQGYRPTYPVAGDKVAPQDHCNAACVIAHMPDDKAYIQLGPTSEVGYFYVDPPPEGCAFI